MVSELIKLNKRHINQKDYFNFEIFLKNRTFEATGIGNWREIGWVLGWFDVETIGRKLEAEFLMDYETMLSVAFGNLKNTGLQYIIYTTKNHIFDFIAVKLFVTLKRLARDFFIYLSLL